MHQAVSDALSRSFRDVEIETDVADGKLLAYLAAKGEVLSTQYTETRVTVHCRIPQKYLGRIDQSNIEIRDRKPAASPETEAELTDSETKSSVNDGDDSNPMDEVA